MTPETPKKRLDWVNNMQERPGANWAYYRKGVIKSIPESEARATFDSWRFLSCEKGAATFMIDQMWNEIDQLRAELELARKQSTQG